MTIQVGQISTPQNNSIASRAIENPATIVDRYNSPGSRLSLLRRLGLPSPDSGNREAKLIFESLRASQATSPELIAVQVSAYSRDQAQKAVVASFDTLSTAHQAMFQSAVDDMKLEFERDATKLSDLERTYARNFESVWPPSAQSNPAASEGTRHILATDVATIINQQILDLRQHATLLREATSPMLSYPTHIVEQPYVPERPNTPSTALLTASGAVLGLLVGVAFALRRESQRA